MTHRTSTTPHHPAAEHCDVLVVGAGPAGLVVAGMLARNGVDVLVVERHSGASPFPKATGVSTRTMEIFRICGIEDRIRAGAIAVDPVQTIRRTLVEPPLFTMPFGYPTDAQALRVSPSTPCCCPQDHLEPVLADHLREQGGSIRFGEQVIALTQHPDGVRVEAVEIATGRARRIHARYLVGADGPRSFVRDAVGIGVDELGRLGDFIAVTFRADLTRRLDGPPGAVNAVDIDGADGVFVPTGPDDRWVYAREWSPGAEPVQDWSIGRCAELIRTASGVPDLCPEILSVLPFVMAGQVARSFRSGRVLLVGDAVHRTTPVGGTGMNTAIQAAHNLGWKLAWVLRGWAGPSLLDSYEAERRPVGTQAVARSLQRGPMPDVPTDTGNALRWDIDVRYPVAPDGTADRWAGARAPHGWIEHRGRRMSTVDLFADKMTLLTHPGGARWRRCLSELVTCSTPILSITVGPAGGAGCKDLDGAGVGCRAPAVRHGRPDTVTDIDGALGRLLGSDPQAVALVRPDGFVAWRSSGGVDAGALAAALNRARGYSGGPADLPVAV